MISNQIKIVMVCRNISQNLKRKLFVFKFSISLPNTPVWLSSSGRPYKKYLQILVYSWQSEVFYINAHTWTPSEPAFVYLSTFYDSPGNSSLRFRFEGDKEWFKSFIYSRSEHLSRLARSMFMWLKLKIFPCVIYTFAICFSAR